MGDIQCDILSGGDMCCIFVRYVDTTSEKIKSFKSLDRHDPEICQRVTHVLFYRGNLPTFPNELSEFFPNLKQIDIYDCGMKKICKEDLKGFTKLEKLKLDDNKISFLPADFFEFTPKLSQISFVNNKISKIGAKIFDKLENLIEADFSRNSTIDYKFMKDQNDLNELKRIIRENCEPMRSLKELATKIVKKNVNDKNIEEISMIANHLRIENLIKSVEIFKILD